MGAPRPPFKHVCASLPLTGARHRARSAWSTPTSPGQAAPEGTEPPRAGSVPPQHCSPRRGGEARAERVPRVPCPPSLSSSPGDAWALEEVALPAEGGGEGAGPACAEGSEAEPRGRAGFSISTGVAARSRGRSGSRNKNNKVINLSLS